MAIRSFSVQIVSLTINEEKSWTPPAGTAFLDIRRDTDEEIRMSFESGQTENVLDRWFPINPDWWTGPGKSIDLSSDRLLYFRCVNAANTLRILIGVE